MKEVQDKLMFPIDTPSNKELQELFAGENYRDTDNVRSGNISATPKSLPTKNQRKRKRKSQKKARRVCA